MRAVWVAAVMLARMLIFGALFVLALPLIGFGVLALEGVRWARRKL